MALRGLKLTWVCIASLFISCSIILLFKFKNSTFLLFPKHFSFCFYVPATWLYSQKTSKKFRGTGYKYVTITHFPLSRFLRRSPITSFSMSRRPGRVHSENNLVTDYKLIHRNKPVLMTECIHFYATWLGKFHFPFSRCISDFLVKKKVKYLPLNVNQENVLGHCPYMPRIACLCNVWILYETEIYTNN